MSISDVGNEIRRLAQERVNGDRPYDLPMSDLQLKKSNFFDLYPLDGGGGLFSHRIIPTVDDAEYARCILEDNALEEFGTLPNLDHHRFERWRSIEKGCWLNRFYFIVPLAKRYALTHDESLARMLVETILHFADTYPPPSGMEDIVKYHSDVYHSLERSYDKQSFEENQAEEEDIHFAWFDFQPASRMIHLLCAMHFLKGSPSIAPDDWYRMIYLVYQHGEVIYHGEMFRDALIPGNNHQSLRGLALLYAGTYLEGLGLWRKYIELGMKIMSFHSRSGFAPDGSLKENSPSYHAFQTWHVRDAVLLSNRYGLGLSADIQERLAAYKGFLQAVTDPSGMSLVINDGYAVNTSAFLRSLDFVDDVCSDTTATLHPDAGMASLKSGDVYLFMDASPFTGRVSHYHGGKNAVTLWYAGNPFLVDSGCCEYDDELFSKWYKNPKAHSSLLVDGVGDGIVAGIYEFSAFGTPKCDGWSRDPLGWRIASSLTSTSPQWNGVIWTREIRVSPDNSVILHDKIDSERQISCTLILNLHPDVILSTGGSEAYLTNGCVALKAECHSSQPITIMSGEGMCYSEFVHRPSKQLLIQSSFCGTIDIDTTFRRHIISEPGSPDFRTIP